MKECYKEDSLPRERGEGPPEQVAEEAREVEHLLDVQAVRRIRVCEEGRREDGAEHGPEARDAAGPGRPADARGGGREG